ncbi:MAG: ATP-binding protein [Candidatus Methanoperedens sp.]|nr:ATP-binding protein [Candidatus Methanoperedens sp.]
MTSDYIIRLIHEYNPHKRGGRIETPGFRRELYYEIEKWLDKKQVLAIAGLRRTGKTTIMRQLMEKPGVDAAFFSFDEEETQKKEVLVFIIDFFINNFGSKYIFLDEIHYIEDWEGVLKRYYDQKNIKFIVSGSESLELSQAKAALAGRIMTFKLDPLTFREYLGLKGKNNLRKIAPDDFSGIEKYYMSVISEKEFFESEFIEYLYKGAFPELVNEYQESVISTYIRELVVKKIIYRDIPAIFEIKRRDLLFEIFRYACSNSANLFEINNLCTTYRADYETVSNYLFYLRSAFLINIAESYSKSLAKRVRRNKKIYAAHPSIAFAAIGFGRDMLVEKILGQFVESAFAANFFWRDRQKNEVDVVLENKVLFPIEVKFQTQITSSDLKGLRKFMEEFSLEKGMLVTRHLFEKRNIDGKEILFVPAWLLMCVY